MDQLIFILDHANIAQISPTLHKKNPGPTLNKKKRLSGTITLLSNISKIYEKMMHICLTSFLNKSKVLSSFFQFGFQSKNYTNQTLISLTEMIQSEIDNDQFICSVFINLQKAIDTVDHEIH